MNPIDGPPSVQSINGDTDSLTALDATFLELEEADESAHMHIGAVMVLDPPAGGQAPQLDEVRAAIDLRLERLPRYRQRLSEPRTGGVRWPRWRPDRDFDIDRHVRTAALPKPAGVDELRVWAGEYFSVRLDRARPLWELVLVPLSGDRWALVSKTHHCLVDGVGSVDAARALLDTEPDAEPPLLPPAEPRQEVAASDPPSGIDVRGRVEGALRTLGRALSTSSELAHGAAHAIGRATDPHELAAAVRRAEAVVEVLVRDELNAAPAASINAPIGTHRRLAVVATPLDTLKEIKAELGGTVNDVVLAAATGGLRRLMLARGEELPAGGLRAMVPVNFRPAADRLGLGNNISSLFVHLPVAEPQPGLRYLRQLDEAEGLKAGNQAVGSRTMIELAALAPPALHSFLARSLFATRLFNLTITNIPGPQIPLYALGSRVAEIWPLVPLAAEHALGIAVLSYDGTVYFCINADQDSCADLGLLRDGIEEEIGQLARLAVAGEALSSASG